MQPQEFTYLYIFLRFIYSPKLELNMENIWDKLPNRFYLNII